MSHLSIGCTCITGVQNLTLNHACLLVQKLEKGHVQCVVESSQPHIIISHVSGQTCLRKCPSLRHLFFFFLNKSSESKSSESYKLPQNGIN